MNKLGTWKTLIFFSPGEVLKTSKGEETSWVYIKESDKNSKTGRRYVLAKCKCGREKRICLNNVRNGNSICCGYSPCRGEEREKDPEAGYRNLISSYKRHAKERGFLFKLEYEEVKLLFSSNCYYCDTIPSQIYRLLQPGSNKVRSGVPFFYNGIDRVDSNKNYTSENAVPCCKICNWAKREMGKEKFIEWIMKVYNKQVKSKDGA